MQFFHWKFYFTYIFFAYPGSFVSWRVGLGSNRRTDHTTVESNLARAHPNYAEANNVRINDIGIIFLNQPVTLSTEIFPIFLPPIDPPAHPFVNVQGMIMGFASEQSTGNQADNNLQAAYVRAMEHSACTQLYMTADPQQHFCANDLQNNSNFCLGDQVLNPINYWNISTHFYHPGRSGNNLH